MKVICPFTHVQPETANALAEHAPDAEYIGPLDAGADYYNVIAELWRRGVAFAIVEHDVVIHGDVAYEFASCPQPWCSFSYSGGYTSITEGLGCARFSAGLIRRWPHFMEEITERHWSTLDSQIAGSLRALGYRVHVHGPPVTHVHRWRPPPGHLQPCSCPTCVWVAGASA